MFYKMFNVSTIIIETSVYSINDIQTTCDFSVNNGFKLFNMLFKCKFTQINKCQNIWQQNTLKRLVSPSLLTSQYSVKTKPYWKINDKKVRPILKILFSDIWIVNSNLNHQFVLKSWHICSKEKIKTKQNKTYFLYTCIIGHTFTMKRIHKQYTPWLARCTIPTVHGLHGRTITLWGY